MGGRIHRNTQWILDTLKEKHSPTYLAVAIAAYTGMRLNEICSLVWNDGFLMGIIKITPEMAKSGQPRKIVINGELKNILMEAGGRWLTENKMGSFLKSIKDKNRKKHVITVSPQCISRHFSDLIKNSWIKKKYHFHDIRHTFLTNLSKTGIDIFRMKQISGHSSTRMLEKYIHPAEENFEYLEQIKYEIEIPDEHLEAMKNM